jgi:hypothetical protein
MVQERYSRTSARKWKVFREKADFFFDSSEVFVGSDVSGEGREAERHNGRIPDEQPDRKNPFHPSFYQTPAPELAPELIQELIRHAYLPFSTDY